MSEKVWIFHSDKNELSQFCLGRDVSEATVIEYLIAHYLDDLEDVFPIVNDPEEERRALEDMKDDLRYERLVEERMGVL